MKIDIINKRQRILVTGGAGFIGGCFIRRILRDTNSIVFNLDKLSYASDLSGIRECKNNKNHVLLKADLSNYQETEEAIIESNPDLIIHLAAESHVDRSIENSNPFIQSNIIGTFNILEATRKHFKNLKFSRRESFRFLHVSTDEVFGSLGKEGLFSEKTPYDPRSPYSASKAASDHLASAWFHTYNLPVIRTNCSNNFGPYQFPEKLIPIVILKALEGGTIPIYGKGDNIRDWLYVEDHVDALFSVIEKGLIGKNYCIGGNNEKTNLEIANTICFWLDTKFPKENSYQKQIKFVTDRPGHDQRYGIDSTLIQEELGWEPKHKFDLAIKKTINWYLKNREWCDNVSENANYFGKRIGILNSIDKSINQ